MRILILNHTQRGHGTHLRAWPIAKGLARKGWDATFVTVSAERYYRTTERQQDGVRVDQPPLDVVRRIGMRAFRLHHE